MPASHGRAARSRPSPGHSPSATTSRACAKVVETSARDRGATHDLVEHLREAIRMGRRAGGRAEDVVIVGDSSTEFAFDVISPSLEYVNSRWIEIDPAAGVAGLAARLVQLVRDRHERAAHRQMR